MTINLTDPSNHPANGPLTVERIERVRDELQRSIQYQNGGDMAYVIADAIKGLEELLVSKVAASEPVTDEELDHLIWGFQREGFHARTLAALVELREVRRAKGGPVAVINGAREPVLYGEHIGIAIGTHLYAAPPAPVVPSFDEWLKSSGQKPLGWVKEAMRDSYDACRAAMTNAVKLDSVTNKPE